MVKQNANRKGEAVPCLSLRAFTLIELLVVIAILSLLVSILLPSLTKAKELARQTICGTQLRSVAIASMMYSEDHELHLPPDIGITQGDIDLAATIGTPHGLAILPIKQYCDARTLHSPCDENRPYERSSDLWNELLGTGTLAGSNKKIRTSYTLREPTSSWYFQINGYGEIVPENTAAIVADRFCNYYAWSFHNGDETTSYTETYGNGDGWHVGYNDSHVEFKNNDPDIYFTGSPEGAGWTWGNRHLNWLYWDEN